MYDIYDVHPIQEDWALYALAETSIRCEHELWAS